MACLEEGAWRELLLESAELRSAAHLLVTDQCVHRVLPAQKKYVSIPADCRYEAVSKKLWGMVLLRDQKPGEDAEFVEVTVPANAEAHKVPSLLLLPKTRARS